MTDWKDEEHAAFAEARVLSASGEAIRSTLLYEMARFGLFSAEGMDRKACDLLGARMDAALPAGVELRTWVPDGYEESNGHYERLPLPDPRAQLISGATVERLARALWHGAVAIGLVVSEGIWDDDLREGPDRDPLLYEMRQLCEALGFEVVDARCASRWALQGDREWDPEAGGLQ